MKLKHLLLSSLILLSVFAKGQTARVLFINNCPEVTFNALDIYIDGNILVNDLMFRHSTQYIDLPAGTAINIGIGEQSTFSVTDTFYNMNVTLTPNMLYVMTGNGTRNSAGFTPYQKFKLDVFANSRESTNFGDLQILFANGSTDAPVMDIRTGIATVANDINYGQFDPTYKTFTSGNTYIFRLTNTNGNKITHNFKADFSTINANGKAVTVITSGFMNPTANNNGSAFGIWLALPSGGPLVELEAITESEKLARVQLIHNSADTAVGPVDVYVDTYKVIDSIDFRNATEYLDAYAGVSMNVAFARHDSTTPFYSLNIQLDSGFTYSAVLHGIESDTFYKPKLPLILSLYNSAKEEAGTANSVDLLFMNGSTDGPVIDIYNGVGSPNYTNNLGYANFSSYSNLPSTSLQGIKIDTGSNNVTLGGFEIKTGTWNLNGKTATIVSSGFIHTDSNSKGPAYGFWLAKPEGGVMMQLPVYINIHSVEQAGDKIILYPNPAQNQISFDNEIEASKVIITDISGKVLMTKNNLSTNTIDISGLATGTYILVVEQEQGLSYSRFQKL